MFKPLLGILLLGCCTAQANLPESCDKNNSACDIYFSELPTIPPMLTCGEGKFFIYQVKSNVPAFLDTTAKIVTGVLPDGSSIKITQNTCGTIAPNGTCSITVDLGTSCAAGAFTINQLLEVIPDSSQKPISSPIVLDVTTLYIAVAAGQNLSTKTNPTTLLAMHNYLGNWSTITTPTNSGILNTATCAGANQTANCIAAGQSGSAPILYSTQDGGDTWNNITSFSPSLPAGTFLATTCSDDQLLCIAVGSNTSPGKIIAYQSQTKGSSWSSSLPPISTHTVTLKTTDCDGSGANIVCAVAGMATTASVSESNLSVLPIGIGGWTTTNDGSSWFGDQLSGSGSVFNGAACSYTGGTPSYVCIFAGSSGSSRILYYTNSSSSFLNQVSISGNGSFSSAACTTLPTSNKAVCIAAGQDTTTSTSSAMLYVNTDTSNPSTAWTHVTTGMPTGNFTSASCTNITINSTPQAVCAVAGQDASGNPILYVNTDVAGVSGAWQAATTTSSLGIFNGISCSTSAGQVVCTVAGTTSANAPLLYVNTDVVNSGTWTAPTITFLPASGVFYGTGVTAGEF